MGTGTTKILIIDDEVDLCILLKKYLVSKDFQVHYAHSLRDGMKLMQEIIPDILLLDNNLPDGIGWKQSDFFFSVNPALRLFLMSGYQPNLPNKETMNYNVLPKPISFSDLEILSTGA
jgi:DNA-binding NtrC family response regulator